jgi:coenzyme F420-0:L-glutamate ligase / coenzyme F420-1:gamma-L-glutamate ligase
MMPGAVSLWPVPGLPLIQPGDDLPSLILEAFRRSDVALQDGDVLVVSSKIVSKSEGRRVPLEAVQPSEAACRYAETTGKDPRLAELVLRESRSVSRVARGVMVTTHRLGFTSANAGIDQSNVESGDDVVLLLPIDPDSSAAVLRERLNEMTGASIGVVVSDTHGRPFRLGNVGVAIGVSGLPAVLDLRGNTDLFGRVLTITQNGFADLVASAAHLVCGEGDEGLPVVLIRGLTYEPTDSKASELVRPPELDLYR